MRALIVVFCIAVSGTSAGAGEPIAYGSAAGCALLARGDIPPEVPSDTEPFYFSGDELYGQDFGCTVSTGFCESDGGEWTSQISVTQSASAALVTMDGETYTLPRCP